MAAKHFNRFKQLAGEKLSVREKSDRLTSNLSEAEKKVEEIRASCQLVIKRLHACNLATGSTFDKHQRKLPQYVLGTSMIDSSSSMEPSVLSNILKEVGQAEVDLSINLTECEMAMENEIIQRINSILEESKKVDKSKKKLSSARLDMDGTRNRYQSIQDKFTPKADVVKNELDQAINHFEQCQDTYATDLFSFLSRERELADILHKMIILQITHHQKTLNVLNETVPRLEKVLEDSVECPAFGLALGEHLKLTERSISYVIEECCLELRKKGMKQEGLFRLAASAAKLKLLKNAFDAGCVDLSTHDAHTVAGALKQYLRELPDPLLMYELHSEWTSAAGIGDEGERMQQLWTVVQKLSNENRENLKYLMFFLHDLSKYHEYSKMNVSNIAIVFGPNLLWSKSETMHGLVGETALYTRIAEVFIRHPTYFFGDPPVLPPGTQIDEPQTPPPPNEEIATTDSAEKNQEEFDFGPNSVISNTQTDNDDTSHSNDFLTSPQGKESPTTPKFHDDIPSISEERPTPPIRRNKSVKKQQQQQPDASPIPSSPKTPLGRPSRPAPQPPPPRNKPRPPPPSPPRDKTPAVAKEKPSPTKEKPSPPSSENKPKLNRDSVTDEETVL